MDSGYKVLKLPSGTPLAALVHLLGTGLPMVAITLLGVLDFIFLSRSLTSLILTLKGKSNVFIVLAISIQKG